MFLTLMVIGLAGLVVMALPALGGHGHAHSATVPHHATHMEPVSLRRVGDVLQGTLFDRSKGGAEPEAGTRPPTRRWLGWIPSPRLVFSLLALYGAFGNALVHAAHLRPLAASLLAALPTLIVERLLVTPLWNLVFRFQGKPSSPMEALVLEDAKAVTPFRNGRGVVAVVRDGRLVQFSAHLVEPSRRIARARRRPPVRRRGRLRARASHRFGPGTQDLIRIRVGRIAPIARGRGVFAWNPLSPSPWNLL